MTSIYITPKYDTERLTKGSPVEAINHGGHYYWIVFLGCWMDKDLFTII